MKTRLLLLILFLAGSGRAWACRRLPNSNLDPQGTGDNGSGETSGTWTITTTSTTTVTANEGVGYLDPVSVDLTMTISTSFNLPPPPSNTQIIDFIYINTPSYPDATSFDVFSGLGDVSDPSSNSSDPGPGSSDAYIRFVNPELFTIPFPGYNQVDTAQHPSPVMTVQWIAEAYDEDIVGIKPVRVAADGTRSGEAYEAPTVIYMNGDVIGPGTSLEGHTFYRKGVQQQVPLNQIGYWYFAAEAQTASGKTVRGDIQMVVVVGAQSALLLTGPSGTVKLNP
jgi:hypothetical protein